MFILHSSNKTENLLAHLCAVIENAPLSSPFAKEVFLIQSQGMERWLSQQLASRFEVFGNFEFLFPGRFFSSLAEKIDLSLSMSAYDRQVMLWRVEALLRRLEGPEWGPLLQYLAGDNAALKRFQLARQLAQIFDQYQILRPDMLAEWQAGRYFYHSEAERWQMPLWREIAGITGGRHRGSLWLDVIAKLNEAESEAFSGLLPERISVFGLNTMPPLFLHYLQGLSRNCQIHLFLLNPAQVYWGDLSGRRQKLPEEGSGGHPLLSALGQQGREFQEMLLEQVRFDFEPESFEPHDARNTLQQLQNDILYNAPGDGLLRNDGSIVIHSCHSRMREVEVLRDQLLFALERDGTLELRDIVVMAPDIEAYEPFISAVFEDIQHTVADRSLRLTNGALDALIGFLKLIPGRFGWQSVLDLLDRPLVYASFDLSETDMELIRYWIQETRVRWGKSAEHKKELELPGFDENTWQAALDRLLMGYAVGSDAEFIHGILPYSGVEGSSAQALGGLCDFLQLLFQASSEFRQAKPLHAWGSRLMDYADQLVRAADPAERREFCEILAALSDELAAVHQDDVELPVVIAWLEGMMTERKSSTGFLRGQLTFCSMLPMRSIPFRVIALLGMNEGEFPKIDRPPMFDLLAHNFRKGDRSLRADDRYQFLEILLSAREQLIVTYIGQSAGQNESMPPSVVVSELLDVLEHRYGLKNLVVRQFLQAHNRRYYDGASGLFSFSEAGLETARALAARTNRPFEAQALWWQGGIQEPEEPVELNDLFSFFRHPQRHFMRKQLDLRFDGIEAMAEEREPFTIGRFDGYAVYQEWIGERLNGRDLPLKKLQAQGRWPPGLPGELAFERQQQEISRFIERIESAGLGNPLVDLPVDLKVGRFRLVGKLGHRYQNGSLIYRYSDLKGRDFLGALLHHLIMNRIEPQPTFLLTTDDNPVFMPDVCDSALLADWLDIYRQGLTQPSPFFVEPALAYVRQAHKLNSGRQASKTPVEAAWEELAKAIERSYEPELRRLYGNAGHPESILGTIFERHCRVLLQPVWDATHR